VIKETHVLMLSSIYSTSFFACMHIYSKDMQRYSTFPTIFLIMLLLQKRNNNFL